MNTLLFLLISFGASVIGAICGIGGGVIIKPGLDLFQPAGVAAISFLSSATVLAMSAYSVGRSLLSGERRIEAKTLFPLASGAVTGGIAGRELFAAVEAAVPRADLVGTVQAACLAVITLLTLFYTVNRRSMYSCRLSHPLGSAAIGAVLGTVFSFLGIGGGPVNLVILSFFFSLDTKCAATSSLYVIFFSQVANVLAVVATRSVPPIEPLQLLIMIAGGITGGAVGRAVHHRLADHEVERLFIAIMALIICISVVNAFRYSGVFIHA